MDRPLLRPMRLEDLDQIVALERVCFRSPWSRLALEEELKRDIALYLVLEEDSKIVGYGGMWVLYEEAHITNVAIAPEFRGRGYGKRLMLGLMQLAHTLDATCMTLEVRDSNRVAQSLYASLGFVQEGRRKKYYGNEDALVLWQHDLPAFFAPNAYRNLGPAPRDL